MFGVGGAMHVRRRILWLSELMMVGGTHRTQHNQTKWGEQFMLTGQQ